MRQAMTQNPAIAQALMHQLAAANPGLVQQIGANPEQFFNALHSGDGEDDEDGPIPPGAHVVSVTPEERAAIERVCSLSLLKPSSRFAH